MRKNKMMRLASMLLVLCLLTTSVISGTFAKYVTTDAQQDSARVAKWGVVASIDGNMFGATYSKANGNSVVSYSKNGDPNGDTVSSFDKSLVVAPGTQNINALKLATVGTPEVSTKVTFDAAEDTSGKDYAISEIYLAKDYTYGVMIPYTGDKTTETNDTYYIYDGANYVAATDDDLTKDWFELQDEVELKADYYPLDWYVGGAKQEMRIGDLYNHVAATFNNENTFAPNTSVAKDITIGWCWDFGDAWTDEALTNDEIKHDMNDYYDTVLGNMMAYFGNDAAVAASDYKVVAKVGDNYVNVSYATIEADQDDVSENCANTIDVVKVGDATVACLTVAFNGRITVEQVD